MPRPPAIRAGRPRDALITVCQWNNTPIVILNQNARVLSYCSCAQTHPQMQQSTENHHASAAKLSCPPTDEYRRLTLRRTSNADRREPSSCTGHSTAHVQNDDYHLILIEIHDLKSRLKQPPGLDQRYVILQRLDFGLSGRARMQIDNYRFIRAPAAVGDRRRGRICGRSLHTVTTQPSEKRRCLAPERERALRARSILRR